VYVLIRHERVEFFESRRWLRTLEPDRDFFVVVDSQEQVADEELVAWIEADGLCYDRGGKLIDSMPFTRAYQVASICLRLDAGCADPERVYYGSIPNESGYRIALTEQLLAAVTKRRIRNRLVSMLFWLSGEGSARIYTDSAIQDLFEELNLPLSANHLPQKKGEAEICIFGLGRDPHATV
jgi:hypothetical protein